MVKQRSWWQHFPQLLARRAYWPIGAAAILTITLASVQFYAPSPLAQAEAEFQSHVSRPKASVAMSNLTVASIPIVIAAREESTEQLEVRAPVFAAMKLSEQLPPRAGELLPWGAPRIEDTPSARSIAANLARLAETEPDLVNSLLVSRTLTGFHSIQDGASTAMEMVAISAVASRRNRLLAAFSDRQFAPDPAAPEVVRERMARRLGDTEQSGGWTRVGLKADRVSLKF
ncbi:MAG: hypothetical protein Q8J74_12950 [Candidatus Didemnitutus sp.]|nr:hypothetical protein [Candidatus Didemnitutus sp.]